MVVSAAGVLASAVARRHELVLAMAVVGLVAFTSRRMILSRMDRLRTTMTPTDAVGIRQFRQLHVTGMVLNVLQLLLICVGLTVVL